jgi:hypothetical protein
MMARSAAQWPLWPLPPTNRRPEPQVATWPRSCCEPKTRRPPSFETPAQFFGQLSEKRWDIVRAAQGKGEMSVRELARVVHRDVKRVHDDIVILAELGLLDRTQAG